jgi:hypothetical protein
MAEGAGMGLQIIKKDNGRYAIWCSTSDDFYGDNLQRESVLAIFAERAVRDSIRSTSDRMDDMEKADYAGPWTYAEACRHRRICHPPKECPVCGKGGEWMDDMNPELCVNGCEWVDAPVDG